MIIGFTGTRKGMSIAQAALVRMYIEDATEFHHGDCVGSDFQAHCIALRAGLRIVIHPPYKEAQRAHCGGAAMVLEPRSYLTRNRHIVDACELLLATPATETEQARGSGTWHTIRYARAQRRNTIIITPRGTLVKSEYKS